jgi:CHAT domain-containing protein
MSLLSVILLSAVIAAQSPTITVDELRRLAAADGNGNTLTAAAREQPDSLRLAVSRTFAAVTAAEMPQGQAAELRAARRLAEGYAHAWTDPFFVREVERFSSWSPAQRRARVAADSLRRAGIDAYGREGPSAALVLWRQGLARVAAVDTSGRAAAMASVGAGFFLVGDLDRATAHLERARDLAQLIGDYRTLGTAVGILASVAKDRGDLTRAATLYEQASAIRERSGDRAGMAADHNNVGLIARALGDLGQARRAFERALDLHRRDGRRRQEALILTNLADIAVLRGEYPRAETLYREALDMNRVDGDLAQTGYVLHDLGLLASRRGDYGRARALLSEALDVHERAGAVLDAVAVRRDLAGVQGAAGNLQEALNQVTQAERDAVAAPDAPGLAAGLALARGDLAMQLGALAEADDGFARAERLARDARDELVLAEARQGRALLLQLRGDHRGALTALDMATRTYAGLGDRRGVALTLLRSGHVQREAGDTATARQTLAGARDSLRALGDVVGEAAALDALGRVAARRGALLAAEQLYRQGLELLGDRPASDVRWHLHAHLAEVLAGRGALDAAVQHFQAAAEVIEDVAAGLRLDESRAGYIGDRWRVFASLALIEHERGQSAAAFEASERLRARQLRDLLARGRVPARGAISEREQDLRRQITELLEAVEAHGPGLRRPGATTDHGPSLDASIEALAQAQQEYAHLLSDLRESDPSYQELIGGTIVPWTAVATRLGSDEVLLSYLVADSGSIVFVVTSDTIAAVKLGVGRAQLVNLIEFARLTMDRPEASPAAPLWRAPLRRLYQYLIEPVERRGFLQGRTRLVIAPHGDLHFLPFAALVQSGPSDRFLVERFDLTQTPSATVWVRLSERRVVRPPGGVLALAPRPESLPASRDEVLSIRRVFGGQTTVLMNSAATKQELRTRAAAHGVVHIASYGILNKHNPLFSFVELAPAQGDDGRLEVHEVHGLDLAGQLVVLSACQTALGSGVVGDVPPGDDWVGLVQAFLHAGASGVIASLWPVEDRATAELMERFYAGLAAGRSEAAALAGAQRSIMRDRPAVHPFHWAGFVLSGGSIGSR